MESSMGQMSNQWEREGHAKKLAVTVMRGAGGMKLTVQFLQRVSGVCQSTEISNYPNYLLEESILLLIWLTETPIAAFCSKVPAVQKKNPIF